jgi:hypothetical protein
MTPPENGNAKLISGFGKTFARGDWMLNGVLVFKLAARRGNGLLTLEKRAKPAGENAVPSARTNNSVRTACLDLSMTSKK